MLPYINIPFEYLASTLGASLDEVKLITSFLLSYPLSALLKRLPDDKPWLKNVFNIAIGLFYIVGLFDLWWGLGTIVLDSAVTYLIAAYIQGPYMPWIGFVWLMGHMSISHIYRHMLNDPAIIDITGAQMVLVMKLSAFCWNVWDGKQKLTELNEVQKERMLLRLPDPLDYAGFVFFFPALHAGPAFDYVDYHRWLNTSMFDLPPGTDPLKAPPTRKKRRIPRSATPAMKKLAAGAVWIILFLQLAPRYNSSIILGDKYLTYNIFRRIFHLHMLGFVTRTKYYGVWLMTEGACILSGIGYKGLEPKTQKPDWGRLTNIRPAGVEFAQSSHAYLGNWNINTNHWLRNYVYLRVTPKGKKPGFRASMSTFVTSAFWHGFEPGYYMAFILASFNQNVAKNSRRLIRPFFMTPDGKHPTPYKRYYDVFTWLVTQLAFTFTVAPFILLTLPASITAWSRVYFYNIIVVAACSIFLVTPGKTYLQKKVKARTTVRPEITRVDSQESIHGATLGVPDEPGKEFDEMVDIITEEVQRRKGSGVMLDGQALRKTVEETLSRNLNGEKAKSL